MDHFTWGFLKNDPNRLEKRDRPNSFGGCFN